MKILKNILFATDFSKSSEYVLENVIEMAKIFHSEVTLIYVLPIDIANKKAKELLNEFANKQLNLINKKINLAGISTTEPVLEHGNFSDKIVQTSERIKANMIVIGAGEKSEGDVFKLGSNAEKIIKKSNKPVFVVKNERQFGIKKIFCPVDLSTQSKRALQNAITMAHRFKAELVIFTAFEVSHLYSIQHKINLEEQIEGIRIAHEKQFTKFLDYFELVGLNLTLEIKKGVPAVEILNAIEKHNSDLLIMGTTGKSGLNKILMGSVTEKVVRMVPCSFITLKKENIIVLEIESKFRSLEEHYNIAQQLFEDGFFEESVIEFTTCLDINFMHLPSLRSLANVYHRIGDTNNETKIRSMITKVLEKMSNEKIESEIRKSKRN